MNGYLSIGVDLYALFLYSVHEIPGFVTNKVMVLLCVRRFHLREYVDRPESSLPRLSWSMPRKTMSSSPSCAKLSMAQSRA